ncbi:hypothetical protein PP707_06900 [Acetobacter pasteurianus]|nr:hypothetical protein [Acetobacter pasteurianus]
MIILASDGDGDAAAYADAAFEDGDLQFLHLIICKSSMTAKTKKKKQMVYQWDPGIYY